MKFGIRGQLTDVITCVKFLVDRFRGYGVLTPAKLPFPIDLLRRPYNSVALPCDTVKVIELRRCCLTGKQSWKWARVRDRNSSAGVSRGHIAPTLNLKKICLSPKLIELRSWYSACGQS